MDIREALASRALPEVLTFSDGRPVTRDNWEERRQELLRILAEQEYGHMPPPCPVYAQIRTRSDREYASKVEWTQFSVTLDTPSGAFSYPLNLFMPRTPGKHPLLLHINFRPNLPDQYMPIEEITDHGYALASLCYSDIVPDCEDGFAGGIAPFYDRAVYDWGKIGMWAWALSRSLDVLLPDDRIEQELVCVAGHSRLGKTALWCGANDPRVGFVYANDSGCAGDALTRRKRGERVADIIGRFPYWFCDRYAAYAGREEEMPFDQHFLIAACAPRCVIGGSAEEDIWADPLSQFLSYAAADPVYRMLGLPGLVFPDRLPEPGDCTNEGSLGFHLRPGSHFFSRFDWNRLMDFIDKKRGI